MKALVYIDKEQIEQLNRSSKGLIAGVVFEWENENVYHAYVNAPVVAPCCYRKSSFFKILTSKREFDNAGEYFSEIVSTHEQAKNGDLILGVFLYWDGLILYRSAYKLIGEKIEECEIMHLPERAELYSRGKGLLETEILQKRTALIIGLGSFGSHIAVELAKSGVGSFILADFDRIEPPNISRHICGISDLGRFKTLALRDQVLLKNPFAIVETYEQNINEDRKVLEALISKADIVICATDNNRSRFNINEVAFELSKDVLFGRAITRAEGGDVFRFRKGGPCYCCLIGESGYMKYGGEEEMTSLERANELLPAYVTEEQKNAQVQVGLSSDILPMCNLMVKLALTELSRGLDSGISSLETELTHDYYFWANRREQNYLNYEPFNNSKGRPTILKWYGVKIPIDNNCPLCSSNDHDSE